MQPPALDNALMRAASDYRRGRLRKSQRLRFSVQALSDDVASSDAFSN